MRKLLIVAVLIVSLLFTAAFATRVYAAVKLTNAARLRVATSRTVRDIRITFSNVKSAKKITYEVTYKRAGLQDGAAGTIIPKKNTDMTKIVTLGTCSGRVCIYHKNVSNIKLKVTTWYSPSLVVETKTYTIK